MSQRKLLMAVLLVLVLALTLYEGFGRWKPHGSGEQARATPLPSVSPQGKQAGLSYPSWSTDEYSLPTAEKFLGGIRDTGAKWVVLIPTWYQQSASSDDMSPTDQTASDESLKQAISKSHALGLRVVLKPHVDLPGDLDRANIHSSHPEQWFVAYSRFITHYASLAASSGTEEFVVGTELAGTSGDTSGWRKVIEEVRRRYGGPVTYAANYDEYSRIQFWDALDFIGVDAYWPLSSSSTADIDALCGAWKPIVADLARLAARWQRPILFTEAGYTSQHGSTAAPFDWQISTQSDYQEQAAGYEALLRTFWRQSWFAGVHWWMWDDAPGSGEDETLRYTPHGKPAEDVLRRWWRA